MFSLEKDIVLIVGGSGTLGKSLMPKLKELGASVVVADVKEPSSDNGSFSPDRFFFLDATKPETIQSFLRKIENEKIQLSHIVNVVGGLKESGLTDIFKTSSEEITETINFNLLSQLHVVHALAKHLAKKEEGDKSIVMISSVNAFAGFSIPFYSAAKGALHGFLKPAAMDLGRYGIRINIVSPGTLHTPSSQRRPKNFEDRSASAALQKLATPDDVADAILYCLLMKAVTAQNLTVDAGQTAGAASSLYDQERRDPKLKKKIKVYSL